MRKTSNLEYLKLSDNQLVELSKNNPDDFSELVDRYQNKLFYFIKRISYFNPEDIEDILQEIFIKVYKNLNNFDGALKFSSWIYQIARNATTDAIRKKHRRPQSWEIEECDLLKIFKSNINHEREVISKDDFQKVKKIISSLPLKYREVMVLRFLEEKEYDEIMDILEKPKGTVATLISRGKKMMIKEAEKQKII